MDVAKKYLAAAKARLARPKSDLHPAQQQQVPEKVPVEPKVSGGSGLWRLVIGMGWLLHKQRVSQFHHQI